MDQIVPDIENCKKSKNFQNRFLQDYLFFDIHDEEEDINVRFYQNAMKNGFTLDN